MDPNSPKLSVNNRARPKMGIIDLHIANCNNVDRILVRDPSVDFNRRMDIKIE